ncbi:MAG: hypothetical protein AABM29_05630 [Actinomycetota bacterium]
MIRNHTKSAVRIAAVLGVAAAGLWAVASAGASHISGAAYNGTIAGAGSLSFTTTADGNGISSLSAPGPIPGNGCTFFNANANYVTPLPITNHAFNDSTPPLYFAGSFTGKQSASGTFRINQAGCDTGSLAWSATTTSAPPITATCKGKAATIVARSPARGNATASVVQGTGKADVIVGTSKRDVINAGGGNDRVCAKGGNDKVRGGGGKDRLYGQGGKDKLIGGGGNDTCVGAGGNDTADCETERSI